MPHATIAERLAELGQALPVILPPAATYVGAVRTGDLLFVSGQIAQRDGEPAYIGQLGAAVSLEDGRRAAELCALGLLSQISAAVDGRLDRVRQVVRLGVFVNAVPGFDQHSAVANGASDLLAAVLGDSGRHARTAVGVAGLPRGVAVEADAVVEVRS